MKARLDFSEILQASLRGWALRRSDECVLSMALPINTIDPLDHLTVIANQQEFSFFVGQSPGLSIAATGQCQNFELIGPRRFELAERFSNETLERLVDLSLDAPTQAKPKILFAFTFFEQTVEGEKVARTIPAVQAVLPRWQLTRQAGKAWLRFNSVIAHESCVRDFVEQFWMMRECLERASFIQSSQQLKRHLSITVPQDWKKNYRLALAKGIDLVEFGDLKKLVLAVRQMVLLNEPLDPIPLLHNLRRYQRGSCRFLWKRSEDESFFGASPERLLSLRKGNMQTDALAGTARRNDDGLDLLKSEKNLREHELVVSSIKDQLISEGLNPSRLRAPRLAKHGHLIHLHTPIQASVNMLSALKLLEVLHPTPAVAGLPRSKSMKWLRTLEPFDRGYYAAPVGWIDTFGNAEFRVAIRCGYIKDNSLSLIAGAGLVKGSTIEGELQEVGLKLDVLADQLALNINSQQRSSSRHLIT